MSVESRPQALALVLTGSSGCAALGYQIVWTQQAALWLGHESAAVLAVVAAFFGGLALGALLLGAKVHTTPSPARWFAACEAVIGVWGLVLAFSLEPVTRALLAAIGPEPSPQWQWTVAFCGTFALLLPATAAMGVTLPAMERAIAQLGAHRGSIAALYAGNTAGAVLGVVAAAFWLVPSFGLAATAGACAALNFIAAAALLAFTIAPPAPRAPGPARKRASPALPLLAATGLLGIGYEVLVVRVLSQVTENTVYTFALLLAVYLVGTALGAALYGRVLAQRDTHGELRGRLLRAVAAACLLSVLALTVAEPIRASVLRAFGGGLYAALAAEAALAVLGFLLPTVAMGALFSHLATTAGVDLGRALGVNTLGAAAAPWLFGVVLLPAIGAKLALLAVVIGYLTLSPARAWRAPTQWAAVGVAVAFALWMPAPTHVDVPPGGHVVSSAEGSLATVSVVSDAGGVETLHINNRQQEGSTATVLADAVKRSCRCCSTRRRAAPCSSGSAPVSRRPRPRRTLESRSMRSSCCRRSSRLRSISDARCSAPRRSLACGSSRPTRAGSCARRRRTTTSSSPTIFILRAAAPARCTPSSIFARSGSGSPTADCSANGCRSINSTSTRCGPSCARSLRHTPTARHCSRRTVSTRRSSACSRDAPRAGSSSKRSARGSQRQTCRTNPPTSGFPTSSRCSEPSSRDHALSRASRAMRL
jgi:hypothetical protein